MNSSAAESDEAATAGTLLDGEDPTSVHLDDPEHWVAVYSELVESTKQMLEAARERLTSPSDAEEADLKLVEREVSALLARSEFFASRLNWWVDRGRELWARKG
jgi:hypothetical protein